jgi:outer membrane protein assembly factor BamD
MLEQNKREVASRQAAGMVTSVLTNFAKHPDVAKASHVGDPTLVDPAPVTATDVVKQVSRSASGSGENSLSVETTGGAVTPNQPAPRSDAPATTGDAGTGALPAESGAADPAAGAQSKAGSADPNELKPNVDADPNALPPLQQSNQLDTSNGTSASSSTSGKNEELADISSSKKKKKKGVGKLNPF